MNPHLASILNSPRLPDRERIIRQEQANENDRRADFYASVTDDHKMEFIEGRFIWRSPPQYRHS